MAVLSGCHEGKATPKLEEIVCPECDDVVEVFVSMGTKTAGQIMEEAKCEKCGFTIEEGTPVAQFEKA